MQQLWQCAAAKLGLSGNRVRLKTTGICVYVSVSSIVARGSAARRARADAAGSNVPTEPVDKHFAILQQTDGAAKGHDVAQCAHRLVTFRAEEAHNSRVRVTLTVRYLDVKAGVHHK